MITAIPNKDSRNISTNSAVTPFFLSNIHDAPSAAEKIRFCRRFSCVNPCLCTQLDIESSSTILQKKVLCSEVCGNTVLMKTVRSVFVLKAVEDYCSNFYIQLYEKLIQTHLHGLCSVFYNICTWMTRLKNSLLMSRPNIVCISSRTGKSEKGLFSFSSVYTVVNAWEVFSW